MCRANEETRMRRRLQASSKPETFAVVSVPKWNRLSERIWGNVETNLSTDCSDFLIPLQWNRIFAMAVKHCFCRTEDTWKFSLWASALGPDNQPTDQTHTALVKWASESSGRTDWLASACLWVVSERPERTLCSASALPLLPPVHGLTKTQLCCQAQGCSYCTRCYPFLELKQKPVGLCN